MKAQKAEDETERAQVKEELQLIILDLQTQSIENREELTGEKIKLALDKLQDIVVDNPIGNIVEGEYKNYGFIINDGVVTVNKRIKGEKPMGGATILTLEDVAINVEILVEGHINNGEIEKIEAIDGAKRIEDDPRNSNSLQIFSVDDNGVYHFRITASSGRSCIAECTVKNATPIRDDIITGIAGITENGFKMIKVNGKISDDESTSEIYRLNVIYHKGDLKLGETLSSTDPVSREETQVTIPGLELSENTWICGDTTDNNNNTVVLKVDGNLTIESGYSLKSVGSVNNSPKGFIVYCSNKFTNNGTITMNAMRSGAAGQNLYLYKQVDSSFMYIKANQGGIGAARSVGQDFVLPLGCGGGGGSDTSSGRTEGTSFGGGTGGTSTNYQSPAGGVRRWTYYSKLWYM